MYDAPVKWLGTAARSPLETDAHSSYQAGLNKAGCRGDADARVLWRKCSFAIVFDRPILGKTGIGSEMMLPVGGFLRLGTFSRA